MNIFNMKISHIILILTQTFIFQNIFAQGIEHYSILLPYHNTTTGIGQTLGGASVALPDSIPVIFNNPASLAQLRHPTGFMSLNYSEGTIDPGSETDGYFNSYYLEKNLSIGLAALSLPVIILNLPVTLAASYNGTMPSSFKVGDIFRRSETSQSTSLGLAVQLAGRFRIGVGGTYRYGRYDTKTFDNFIAYIFRNTSVKYSGNIFHIGLQNDIAKRFALGVVYYFPASLDIEVKRMYWDLQNDYTDDYSRRIPAALRFGLGFRFSAHGTLGVGYGYQWLKGFDSDLSSYSAGIEYKLHLNKIFFPLYVMYENRSVSSYADEFMSFSSQEKATCHILGLGGGFQWQAYTLYFSAQWSECSSYEVGIIPAPPWS